MERGSRMDFNVRPRNTAPTSSKVNDCIAQKTNSFFVKEAGQLHEPKKGDFYYQQLQMLFLAWKCLGVFPVHVSDNGTLYFKLISIPTFYSLLVYVLVICVSYLNAIDRITYVNLETSSFLHNMYTYIIILLMVTYPSATLTFWTQLNKIKDYIESWKKFQIEYIKTMHLPLQIQLKRTTNITVIAEVFGASCVGFIAFLPPHQSVWRFIPYYFNMLLFDVLVSYWIITCIALRNANECLLKHIKIKNEETIDHWTLGKYRILWLRLSQLTNQTGHAISGVYIIVFIFEFVLLTFSLYCLLSGINKEESTTLLATLIAFAINVAPLYLMCNAAHETTYMINTEMKNELEVLKSVNHKLVSREVSSFLLTMLQNPADISLSGFMTVNRGLFKSYACVIVTYLVVLMQFEIGLESNKDNPVNSTSVI